MKGLRVELVMVLIAALLLLRRWLHQQGRRLGGDRPASQSRLLTSAPTVADANKDDDAPSTPAVADGAAGDGSSSVRSPSDTVGRDVSSTTSSSGRRDDSPKFERQGHVAVVRRRMEAEEARGFASRFSPPVHVVLLDERGIGGELRTPQLEVLYEDQVPALAAANSLLKAARRQLQQASDSAAATSEHLRETLGFDSHEGGQHTPPSELVTPRDAVAAETPHPCLTGITEGGTRYILRSDLVMFCGGNATERMHFRNGVHCGKKEVVVDMFAGIGYFSLPLACSDHAPHTLYALEKNPVSARLLALNIAANTSSLKAKRVRVLCGDNRVVGGELLGTADRVIMGYIPNCGPFLKRAVGFLRRTSDRPGFAGVGSRRGRQGGSTSSSAVDDLVSRAGTIHYHYLAPSKKEAYAVAHAHVVEYLGEDAVGAVRVDDVRVVKSFAPRRFHCVADLVVDPRRPL